MDKPWKVILAFAGVFIAGAIFGGALAPRWLGPDRPSGGGRGAFGGQEMMSRLEKELSLTAGQKEKIAPIVTKMEEETRQMRRESVQKFREAMSKSNVQIEAVLTPEQRTKFEDMRKRFRERLDRFRGEFRGKDREGPPPPPDDRRT